MPSPVRGKTYSLFGPENDTRSYFQKMQQITDLLLEKYTAPTALLHQLQNMKFRWRPSLRRPQPPVTDADLREYLTVEFAPYLTDIDAHLRNRTFFQRFDRTLSTPAWRYPLFMLEIEITNRIYQDQFRQSDHKIALLPHCLRDFSRDCQAKSDGVDYLCRRCSRTCPLRQVSDLLQAHQIQPYIWRQVRLKQYLGQLIKAGKNVGVLGIACIPELVSGLRRCIHWRLPVVGLPLNANRCQRWLGAFYDNSVDLDALTRLVATPGAMGISRALD